MKNIKKGKLLLYWDYELQRGADVSRRGCQTWGKDDFYQTKFILDLLDKYEIKATFAALGFAALEGGLPYHAPEQIQEIAGCGHEIASHTWGNEWITKLSYDELKSTLSRSKKELESLTGRSVISFVPPWNAPTRYLHKAAFGFYDWRGKGIPRIDIPTMCRALSETGYKTARIGYEPLPHSLSRHILGRIIRKPDDRQLIEGVLCFKTNNGGFSHISQQILQQAAEMGKIAVIFAHPHSLIADNNQNKRHFLSFLDIVSKLKMAGKLITTTPGEIYYDR